MNTSDIKKKIAKLNEAAAKTQDRHIKKITRAVCFYFGMTAEDLKTKRRFQDNVYPRQVFCYLVYQNTIMGHRKIAKWFEQNHTTVMDSILKIRGLIDVGDEKTLEDVGLIIKNFNKLTHVKKKNPYEYRNKFGQKRTLIPPELHKKRGRKKGCIVKSIMDRPPAHYSNSGHINLTKRLEQMVQ